MQFAQAQNPRLMDEENHVKKKQKIEVKANVQSNGDSSVVCPYYFCNGLRFVRPYQHTFETFIKRRWLGCPILAILHKEFEAFDFNYYRAALKSGAIRINGNYVAEDFILKDNQKITHTAVIKEPPVVDSAINLLGVYPSLPAQAALIVVDKPCGMPMHPCAAYRLNTLCEMVKRKSRLVCQKCVYSSQTRPYKKDNTQCQYSIDVHQCTDSESNCTTLCKASSKANEQLEQLRSGERTLPSVSPRYVVPNSTISCQCLSNVNLESLRPLHRLDRLTSGVVVFGCNSQVAREFELSFRKGKISKIYIARVIGDFKKVCGTLTTSKSCLKGETTTPQEDILSHDNKYYRNIEGEMICIDRKHAVYQFIECHSGNGKSAETKFEFVVYNDFLDESIVLCYPKTGRTHQLRAQLLYLGHPISNDPCYGPQTTRHLDWFPRVPHTDLSEANQTSCTEERLTELEKQDRNGKNQNDDAKLHASGIFLHAWKYFYENEFAYESVLPNWCCSDF